MKSIKIELKWALFFSLTLLVWMWGEKLLGYHDERIDQHMIITNFFYIPAIALYVLTLRDKRNNYFDGKMTYKQGFIAGLIMSIITTLLVPPTQAIVSLVITPEYFKNVIAYVVEHDMMTVEAAKAQFNLSNYILQGMISFPVVGAVTSAIIAFFMKRA